MTLNAVYTDQDEIPENYRDLYSENNGRFELTGVAGIKTEADVTRLQQALAKERNEHKEAKTRLSAWGDLDKDTVASSLDELETLRAKVEAGAGGEFDDEKFNKAVEANVASKTVPLKRDLEKLQLTAQEQAQVIAGYQEKELRRTIHDEVRKATDAAKVLPTAVEDVLMLAERMFEVTDDGMVVAKDAVGVTPGIDPSTWMAEMQEKRPHWWPASVGGGANGGSSQGGYANNPWSADHWNMTAQGTLLRQDRAKAERMAKAAGTKIGGQRPAAKK